MTKGELGKGVAIRLITAAVFGVIGYFAITYALEMVGIFGEGMGVDARSREIYATSHKIVHIFAGACALALGVFVVTGHKTLRWLALAGVICAGGYGVFNMIGFTSTNRVAVAAAKDSDRAAIEREYQNARVDLQKQIGWLEKQVVYADHPREKRRMEQAVDAKRKELSALKAPRFDATKVLSDPLASTLGEITSTTDRKWQLLLPVLLAFLMFFAESFSWAVVGHMLAGIVGIIVIYRTSQAMVEPKKTHPGSDGSSGSGGGEPKKKPDLKSVPKPEPASIRAEPSKQRRSWSYVPATGAPERNLSAFDRAYEVASQHPYLSTRAIAAKAGVSQSTGHRVKKRALTKVDRIVRKYGNGEGF